VQPSAPQYQATGIFLSSDSASSTWKYLDKELFAAHSLLLRSLNPMITKGESSMSCLQEANRFVTTFKERSHTGSLWTGEMSELALR